MLGHQQPVIPDYVRCGSALYYVTWPRLVTVCVAALLLAVGFSELQEHMPVESELSSDRASYGAGGGAPPRYDGGGIRGLLGKAASRLVKGGGGGGGGKGGAAADRPPVMPSWCKNKHGSLYFLEKWKLAFLSEGSKDYPLADAGRPDAADADAAGATDGAGQKLCDWVPATKMQVEFPFSLCTFDRTVDTQVSAFVHKDGVWNNGKRELLELVLPRVNEMMDLPERTLVIDVGANIGFYSLLAASRGYDIVAIEPAKETLLRLLHSLRANGVKIARSGRDEGINSGHTRMPIAYVYENAASDVNTAVTLRWVADNPGATWIEEAEVPVRPATTVVLDDLLDAATRDPNAGPHPDLATSNVVNPLRVRLLKISAEGFDARVLHGARRLLSLGRVPYIHLVFNTDHIRNRDCDARALILALFEAGYRLFSGGVFIYREKELSYFLQNTPGMAPGSGQARSTELLFVREGAPFLV